MSRHPPRSTLFPSPTLSRSAACGAPEPRPAASGRQDELVGTADVERLLVSTQKRKSPRLRVGTATCPEEVRLDRKSTRLNSSHANISYAVFCLKKKKNTSIT